MKTGVFANYEIQLLTQCLAVGQALIWNLTKALWQHKGLAWSKPVFGEILACSIINLKNEEGKYLKGKSQLRHILISESAHLIWKLRNDQIINGNQLTPLEVQNKWRNTINARLEIDCLSINPSFKSRSNKAQIIKQTWRRVINHKEDLPREWTKKSGVLVDIRAGIG